MSQSTNRMTFRYEDEMTPIVSAWLLTCGLGVRVRREKMASEHGICDLVGIRHFPRVGRRIPEVELLVAVELKLDSVAGVLYQAVCNRADVNLSYVAMPDERFESMRGDTFNRFRCEGIGVLSVGGSVKVLSPAIHYGFGWEFQHGQWYHDYCSKNIKARCWRWMKPYRVMRGEK